MSVVIPKNKSAEELLKLAGFSYGANSTRGWTREPLSRQAATDGIKRRENIKGKPGRLHALVRDGVIEIHYDVEVDGRHITKRFNNNAKAAARLIFSLDSATK